MGLEKIVKMVAGGLVGYFAAPLLIPYSASYAYAAVTRITTTATGAYLVSSIGSSKKSA